MRKLLLLIFIAPIFFINAQTYGDGCMNATFRATWAWNQEYEDPIANDESNWRWWFLDVANLDGTGWQGGQCLAQGGFFQIGWWNHSDYTVSTHTYGTPGPTNSLVPQFFALRGAYEGDDCGGSCDSNTSCFFDDDDYRYDQTMSSGFNYRFAPPNSNNAFQSFTTNHGSSDFGGEFTVRYTSPRPLVSASLTQICFGQTTAVTFNFSGAIFGGNYVMVDAITNAVVHNSSASSTTLNLNSARTYNVYTSNGGVRSNCYSVIVVNTYSCNSSYNCDAVTLAGGTVAASSTNGSLAGGLNQQTNDFTTIFPTNSYIVDVNVPATGGYNASLMELQHNNTTVSTSVVSLPSGFIDLRADAIFDLWWDNPGAATTAGPADIEVCACKTANFGIATVDGSSSGITICEDDPGTITLAHNGSITALSTNGFGDELRWYSGSCGGTYLGSGLSLTIPSPTSTTTYYASMYSGGSPCRGSNNYCESVIVTATPQTVPGTLSPDSQVICVNTPSANLTLSGHTGSVTSWEYSSDGGGTWAPAAGTSTDSVYSTIPYTSLPGTHFFRAVIQNGVCDPVVSSTAMMIVNINPEPGVVGPDPLEVCSDSAFIMNASAFVGDVQWQLSTISSTTGFVDIPGENSPSLGDVITNATSSNISRWYRVRVTNAPCSAIVFSASAELIINPQTVAGAVTGTLDTICENGNPGYLSLSGHIGSVQNWLVQFNGGAYTNIVSTNTSYAPGAIPNAGTYEYFAVVKSGDCDADTSAGFEVLVLPEVVTAITGGTEICQGSSLTLTASASGGNGTYSYQWQRDGFNVGTNSSTLAISSTLSPATYSYTVIVSSDACSTTSMVHQVEVIQSPFISNILVQNIECYNVNIGAINIIATADSFSIDSGVTYSTSNNYTNLAAGSYNISVLNLAGCEIFNTSNPIVITQPDSISMNFDIVEPNCATSNDGEILVNAIGGTPGYEYAINGGAYQSGNNFTGLAPGTYTLYVKDNNDCVNTKDTTLTAQYTFDLLIDSLKDVSCPGSADAYVELETVGGVSPYTYSSDNAIFTQDSVFENLVAGSYTFYALDSNGCSDVVSVNIVESPPIQISLDSVVQISCSGANDAAIYISVTGSTMPYTYDWKLNGVSIASTDAISGLGAGTYNLSVITSSSCIATLAVNIIEPSPLSASIALATNPSCAGLNDGSVQVNVSGGATPYSFSWVNASSTVVGIAQNLNSVGGGSYTLTVTDANGCTSSVSATLTDPNPIGVSLAFSNPSCSNSNDGEIIVSAGGGTPGYTYSLNGASAQNSNTFSGLSAGSYSVTVTDANGCTGIGNTILTSTYSFSIAVQSQSNVSCAGQNNGSVTLQNTGGQAPISYTINGTGSQVSNVFAGLTPGLYTFEATDVNGCTASVSVTITSNPPMNLNLDSTSNVLCNGQNTGEIHTNASGGGTPYSFSLNGGTPQASGSFTALAAGSYNLVVTDANGCSESVNVTLTEPSSLSANVGTVTDVSCAGLTDGAVQTNVAGGTPAYSFDWTNASSVSVGANQNLSGVGAGTYTLTVTDDNACTATANATIFEPVALTVSLDSINPSCGNSNDGEITVMASGGTAAYAYSLNGAAAQSSNIFSGLVAGTYMVTVTDANGCTGSASITLSNNYVMSLAIQSQTNVSCAGQNDGSVNLQVTGGQAPFSYTINGGGSQASNMFTGLTAGLYNFVVTDSNGCSAMVSTTITSNPPLQLSLDSTTNLSCNGQNTGEIHVSTSGGATPYSYTLNGGTPQASGSFTAVAAGSYTVEVTDSNGCTENVNATITSPNGLTATIGSVMDVTCPGDADGSAQANISGGSPAYTFEWTNASNVVVGVNQSLNGVGAGMYTLTVTDANGCTDVTSAMINQPIPIAVSMAFTNPSCGNSNDGEISVSTGGGTPGYTYSLNGAAAQNSNTFSGLSAGPYAVTVTDANGCTGVGNTILTNTYTFSISVQAQTNVSCAGQSDGSVTLQVAGGQTPINYTINGSGSQTSNVFSSLASGLYTFEATDVNGCTASVSTTITSNPPLTFSLDSTTNVLCSGQNTGAVYVSTTGGGTPYSYSLNGGTGQASGSFTGLAAGSYSVIVTDANGCTESVNTALSTPNALTVTVGTVSDVSCAGLVDGSIQTNIAGGTPAYSFDWTNASSVSVGSNQNLNGVGAGTYTLTVTDDNGCTAMTNATIFEPAAMTVSLDSIDPSCGNSNNGEITATVTGGTAAYTYSLNGAAAQSGNVFAGLASGAYTVMVTDANGCTETASTTLTNTYNVSLSVQSQTNVSCAGQNDGTVTLLVTGGQSPFSYTINGGGSQAGNIFTGLTAGLYNFEVTDANGCTSSVSTTITSNPPMTLSIDSIIDVECNGQNTGAIYLSTSGGGTPYSYSVNGGIGQASGSFTGLSAGSYNVVVTDANGCSESVNATINAPSLLTATVGTVSDVSCAGLADGSIQVNIAGGTPAYSFDWTNASSVSVGTNQNLNGVGAGTYTLTVTDDNGCTAMVNATIFEPVALTVSLDSIDPSCGNSNNGVITVTATGGTAAYTYSLNGAAAQSGNIFTGLASGSYTVLVTDANGCTGTATTTLTNAYTISLAVQSQTNVSCAGQNDGTVTLLVTGGQAGFTYTINGGGTQGSNVFTGLNAGLYNFEVTDANGCTASASATITSNPPMALSLDSTTNVLCNGQTTGEIHVSTSGGGTPYSYSLNGGTGQVSGSFTGLAAGSYNVVVTDANGCTETVNTTISSPSILTANVGTITDVSCAGLTDGAIQANVAGGTPAYTFNWTDASSVSVGNSQNLSGVGAGAYTLTVTDDNGCIATFTANVTEPAALVLVLLPTNPSCANSGDGSISSSATGGTGTYVYSLNNGPSQVNGNFSGLVAGTYTVTVTDANGCTDTDVITLTNTYSLSLAVQSQTNVSCFGQNDGTVTLQTTGGQAGFTYTVNGNGSQTGNVFTGLAPGLYTFEVTDANGCTATTSTTISSNPPLVVQVDSVTNLDCAGSNTGAIYISASGGNGTYTYLWSNAAITQNLTGVAGGTYTVTVTDGAGCSVLATATINSPSPLALVVANFQDVLCVGNTDAYVDVSVAGGTAPYTFSWSEGTSTVGTNEDLFNVGAGTYTLTVTDDNGCTNSISQTVVDPAPLTGMITTTDEICFGDNAGTASVTVSGGRAPYTYFWSTFENTASISGLGSGAISVQVTDANGCQINLADTISGPAQALTISLVATSDATCFGGSDGSVEIAVNGGTAAYTIAWNPGGAATNLIDNLTAGVYTATVTDANGCVVTEAYVVGEGAEIISAVSITNPNCFGQETGFALVNATGGAAPLNFTWNTTPAQTGALANNLAGDTSYIVTITDFNGCLSYDTARLTYPAQMLVNTVTQGVSCIASQNGEVAIEVTGGNAPFTYELNGFMQVDSIFEDLDVGTYVVFVLDNNNCSATTQFDIDQNPVLELQLSGAGNDGVYWTDDLFIIRGEQVALLADVMSNGLTVVDATWSSVSSANLDTTLCVAPCLDPTMMPEEDVTVMVSVLDSSGCVVTDTLNVNVSQEAQYFMPTAFTPNDDCMNDNFEINVLGATNLDVRIYNRWGEQLFHNPTQENALVDPLEIENECLNGTVNPRNAWDGSYNGQPMPNGAYTYQIDATMFDGSVETVSGTVTILR